jgi:hypothetical protein
MTAKRVKQGVDYQSVAVCSKDPRWYLRAWDDLTDDIFPGTHLAQADELLVDEGAEYSLGDEWRFDRAYGAVSVYKRRGGGAYGAPPSGVPLMAEAAKPGVSPNGIYCSQGLRNVTIAGDDIPFRVAPRYQGVWFEEAKPLTKKETDAHIAMLDAMKLPGRSKRDVVNIGIVDTGIAQGPFLTPLLEQVVPPRYLVGAASADPPDPDDNGTVESPAGHGTFVTGVIAQLERRVRVHVIRAVGRQGAVSDLQLAEAIDALVESLRGEKIELDILNLSLGGWTYDDRKPRLTGDRIDRLPGSTLVVAAAGNMQSQRPFWPAAMEPVVAVGAVVKDGDAFNRAEYSNYGRWVNAVAHDGGAHVPGGRSVGDQTSTFYASFPPANPHKYPGWAKWRGTSFTTPTVAARIAQRMLDDDLRSGQEAWQRIRRQADDAPPDFPNAVIVT